MRAIITGASRGIGRAIAQRLAHDGAQVAICASSHADELETLRQEITQAGGVAVPLIGDLTQEDTPARLVAQACEALGGLDAVIGNAGISQPGKLAELDIADWDRVFSVNLKSQWLLAKAAYPWLKLSQGSMVVVGSMCGVQPYAGLGAYSCTKAGLIMLTRQLAQEWASDQIRVNCISPGFVVTPLTQPLYNQPEVKAAREALVPLGRIAHADSDIAGMVAFLLSNQATYLTGQNLLVDGGLLDSVQTHISGRPRTAVQAQS